MTTISGQRHHRRGSDDSRDDSGYESGSQSGSSDERSGGDDNKIIEGFAAHGHGGAAITKNKTVIICFGKPEDGKREFSHDGVQFTFESKYTNNPFSTFEARTEDDNGGTHIHKATIRSQAPCCTDPRHSTRRDRRSRQSRSARRMASARPIETGGGSKYDRREARDFTEHDAVSFATNENNPVDAAFRWATILDDYISEHGGTTTPAALLYTSIGLSRFGDSRHTGKERRTFARDALRDAGVQKSEHWRKEFSNMCSQVYSEPTNQDQSMGYVIPPYPREKWLGWLQSEPETLRERNAETRNWIEGTLKLFPSMHDHNMESKERYIEALVHQGTQLTEARNNGEKASDIANRLTEFAKATGHDFEVNWKTAKSMLKEIKSRHSTGKRGYNDNKSLYAALDEELSKPNASAPDRESSEWARPSSAWTDGRSNSRSANLGRTLGSFFTNPGRLFNRSVQGMPDQSSPGTDSEWNDASASSDTDSADTVGQATARNTASNGLMGLFGLNNSQPRDTRNTSQGVRNSQPRDTRNTNQEVRFSNVWD